MAQSSFGALLQIGDGASPTEQFTTVAEVRDGGGLARTQTTQETTHHGSTEGWREYIATLRDGGEPTFELNWLASNATHEALLDDFEAGTVRNFKVVYAAPADTDNEVDEFAAIITNLTHPTPVDGVDRVNLTLRTTGKVTNTAQS